MEHSFFAEKLLTWYRTAQRDLPWRHTANPYYIWLSEVILQQTRVAQGMPYYYKFIETFPTVFDLAAASESEVLRLWQGLGYYSRARNLHATAKQVVEAYGGVFPQTYEELLKLKGVGSYTAAAIASFAFDERVAVLDGNVYRVLARVFGIETDIASHEAKKIFMTWATALLPSQHVNLYNQAIMEFGAIQCTPGVPSTCMFCVFAQECTANATQRQGILPVKTKKVKVKERFFHYIVVQYQDEIALKKRSLKDIWAEMYDFHLVESTEPLQLDDLVAQDDLLQKILPEASIVRVSDVFTHILTHQKIQTTFWHVKLHNTPSSDWSEHLHFYTPEAMDGLPKPILIHNYLTQYLYKQLQ